MADPIIIQWREIRPAVIRWVGEDAEIPDPAALAAILGPAGPQGPAGSKLIDMPVSIIGKPGPLELILRARITTAIDNLAIVGDADVAATAPKVFTLTNDNVQVATVTFAIGATNATVVLDNNTLAPGVLRLTAPAVQDATLAGISITISGERQ